MIEKKYILCYIVRLFGYLNKKVVNVDNIILRILYEIF